MQAATIFKYCKPINSIGGIIDYILPQDLFFRVLRSALRNVPFDEVWYLSRYPDVAKAIHDGRFLNANEHFIKSGFFEHRMPYKIIVDEQFYITRNPDVRDAIESGRMKDAQAHFEVAGFQEGRLPSEDFCLF